MKAKWWITIFLAILFSACSLPRGMRGPETGMPNPASVNCEEQGGRLEIQKDAAGGEFGVCVFPDGSVCEEWALMRGECQAGQSLQETEVVVEPSEPTAESVVAQPEGWIEYRGQYYSLRYPAGSAVEAIAPDPAAGMNITGPLENDEHWPVFGISHPQDDPAYRPSEGADLESWLSEHNLLMGERLPDRTIAGEPAVHLRQPRSEQTYAMDMFFFIHTGQLYKIIILHAGDKEDWGVYEAFLGSVRFE